MNPTKNWVALVNATMAQHRCNYDEAWRLTKRAHPDAHTLMCAFGQTREQIQFFNSRRAKKESAPERKQAKEQFHEEVKARMQFVNCSYDQAWAYVTRTNRPLADLANGKVTAPSFANDGNIPIFGHQLRKLFFLPMDSSQEEGEAAWRGNGETTSPINPGKIFAGMVEYLRKTNPTATDDQLTALAKSKYPDLWQAVETIAGKKV